MLFSRRNWRWWGASSTASPESPVTSPFIRSSHSPRIHCDRLLFCITYRSLRYHFQSFWELVKTAQKKKIIIVTAALIKRDADFSRLLRADRDLWQSEWDFLSLQPKASNNRFSTERRNENNRLTLSSVLTTSAISERASTQSTAATALRWAISDRSSTFAIRNGSYDIWMWFFVSLCLHLEHFPSALIIVSVHVTNRSPFIDTILLWLEEVICSSTQTDYFPCTISSLALAALEWMERVWGVWREFHSA